MKALASWWPIPGWRSVRLTAPRVPLGFTLATTLVFLLVPALLLRQLPRPQALGLEKLMANVSLLQSFRAASERPVPDLWRQRLGGPLAQRLWRLQTRTWWQFWDGHADGEPFLAISSRGLPISSLRALAVPPLKVGDLAILSPDLLSRQMLSDRLRPQVRPSPGLRLRCLPRLERDQAVFWRPSALGVIVGPLASFLQDFQEGCLSLSIRSDGLIWSGEAASVEGMLLPASLGERAPEEEPAFRPSAADSLLEVQGQSLERLLAGLLARELIRQPLAERYGFGREQIALLRRTPFRLVLRPLADGPFQASVELTVLVDGQERQWKEVLARVAANLQKEGLRPHSRRPTSPPPPPPPPPGSATPPLQPSPTSRLSVWPVAWWTRQDGVVVGGWQRRLLPGGKDQITLVLGPRPTELAPLEPGTLPAKGAMRMMVRPRELAQRGLLPAELPEVVQRSAWLWVTSEPLAGKGVDAAVSLLRGKLSLRP